MRPHRTWFFRLRGRTRHTSGALDFLPTHGRRQITRGRDADSWKDQDFILENIQLYPVALAVLAKMSTTEGDGLRCTRTRALLKLYRRLNQLFNLSQLVVFPIVSNVVLLISCFCNRVYTSELTMKDVRITLATPIWRARRATPLDTSICVALYSTRGQSREARFLYLRIVHKAPTFAWRIN